MRFIVTIKDVRAHDQREGELSQLLFQCTIGATSPLAAVADVTDNLRDYTMYAGAMYAGATLEIMGKLTVEVEPER